MLHCSTSLVQVEHDLFAITGSERDARAFVEIITIEGLTGLQARGACSETSLLFSEVGDALIKHAFLSLQIDIGDEALTACDSLGAEIENCGPKTDAEQC